MKDEQIGSFEELPFPIARTASIDTVTMGKSKHHIPILLEMDVTLARIAMKLRKERTGEGISFTGWIIKCLAQAASEHKRVHAMRLGRKKLILFEDVDVSTVVNRQISGSQSSETLPMPYVIRKANAKSLEQIHSEIRAAQTRPLAPGEQIINSQQNAQTLPWKMRVFFSLPFFLRKRLVWNRLVKDPFYAKKMMGTVVVSSIGMYGKVNGGGIWAIPTTMVPLPVFIGGIARKPGMVDGHVEPREVLSMTVLFDHDVVDGAPVTVFLQRLRDLIESGAFL